MHKTVVPTAYGAFDWLRIVLATAVALDHAEAFPADMRPGDLSVQVFFALSGWLIGGLLLHTKPADLPRFYFNRAVRIWIPYFIALGVLLLAAMQRDAITTRWLEFVFYKLTFVYNAFGHPFVATSASQMPLNGTGTYLWSICAEEQFYLVAPLALCLLPARWGQTTLLWLAIVAATFWFGAFESIALGVLAAILKQHHGDWHLGARARLGLLSLAAVAGVMVYQSIAKGFATPVFSIAVVLLLAVPMRRTAAGEFWGGVSYPLYLNHWLGLFAAHFMVKRVGMEGTAWEPLLGVALALLVATVLYVTVEREVHKRREGWFTRSRGVVLGITGWALVLTGLAVGLLRMTTSN